MFKHLFLFVATALLLIVSSNAFASTIKLTSGETIERKINYHDNDMIKIDSGYGVDITYYLDEIESIDGKPASDYVPAEVKPPLGFTGKVTKEITEEVEPVVIEEKEDPVVEEKVEVLEPVTIETVVEKAPIVVDKPEIKEPPKKEPEIIKIVDPADEIKNLKIKEKIEVPAPVIKQEIKKIIPIVEPGPVKDLGVVEEKSQVKEASSPFGPTIKENSVKKDIPQPVKKIKVPVKAEPKKKTVKNNEFGVLGSFVEGQLKKVSTDNNDVQKKLSFIKRRLHEIPVEIRRDILGIVILVFIFIYAIFCFPLMWIAMKLHRKHSWLIWVPVLQIPYCVYLANRPLWWTVFFFVPVVNILLPFVLIASLLRELKSTYWFIIPSFIPVLNIFVLWYLALSPIKND